METSNGQTTLDITLNIFSQSGHYFKVQSRYTHTPNSIVSFAGGGTRIGSRLVSFLLPETYLGGPVPFRFGRHEKMYWPNI